MKLLLIWVINALTLLAIPQVTPSVSVASNRVALITALVFGLFNAGIRPLLVLLTLPINVATLGLSSLVINGLLFWFVFANDFYAAGCWAAFWSAIAYSVISTLASWLLVPRPR